MVASDLWEINHYGIEIHSLKKWNSFLGIVCHSEWLH